MDCLPLWLFQFILLYLNNIFLNFMDYSLVDSSMLKKMIHCYHDLECLPNYLFDFNFWICFSFHKIFHVPWSDSKYLQKLIHSELKPEFYSVKLLNFIDIWNQEETFSSLHYLIDYWNSFAGIIVNSRVIIAILFIKKLNHPLIHDPL